MKLRKKPTIIIIILIIIGGSYYWYKKTHSTATATQYITATAEKGTLITSVSGSGNIIVDQNANIDPTITGTVTNLSVNVGDKVEQGQLLFSIVNDQLAVNVSKSVSSYQNSLSSLESAKAQEEQASADYDDAKKPSSGKSHDQKDALEDKEDAAEAGVETAKQNIVSAQADLDYQRQQAAKRRVTSPISGTVNEINIKNGDDLSKLSSGSSRLVPMIIGDLLTLKAQIQVNEVDIANVQIGQKVTLTFNAIDSFTATGKVEKIASLGTLSSGVVTYDVTISFDSLDSRIKPEMSVSAAITTSVKQDVITVPNSAVKTKNGTSYVEILNGTAPQQVNVEVGATNNTDTEIISGINTGDKVVTQTISSSAPTTNSTTSQSSANRSSGGLHLPGLGGGGRPD